jgi:hypothetical protein
MMIAEVGSSLNVMGMRIAVRPPPQPRQDADQASQDATDGGRRFGGESAVANPLIRVLERFHARLLHPQNAARQNHLQLPEDVRRAETPRAPERWSATTVAFQNPEEEDAEKDIVKL